VGHSAAIHPVGDCQSLAHLQFPVKLSKGRAGRV
jgi:hypothetical protein